MKFEHVQNTAGHDMDGDMIIIPKEFWDIMGDRYISWQIYDYDYSEDRLKFQYSHMTKVK